MTAQVEDKIYWHEAPSADWNSARRLGKAVRHCETNALQAHGISDPEDFAYFTDCTNNAVYGCGAEEARMIRGIGKKESLRDYSSQLELLLLAFHENAVASALDKSHAQGREEIEKVWEKVDEAISNTRLSFPQLLAIEA